MIEGICFDFWESLFGFVSQEELKNVRWERSRMLSELLNRPLEEVDETYTNVVLEMTQWREKTGFEFCVEDLMKLFLKRMNAPLNLLPECQRIFVDAIKKHFPGPNPGAKEALEILKNKGYKLAIISNTIHGTIEEELLREYEMDHYFDVKALSCRLGVRKPRRDIFLWTSYRLGIPPSRLIHIGDDPEADVAGALRAGFWSGFYIKPGKSPVEKAHINIDHWEALPEALEELR